MASIAKEIEESFRSNDVIIKLIYVNTALFLLMRLMDLAALSGDEYPGWAVFVFGMPIGLDALLKPWTIATNIIAHYDFVHFIFNMLCLYCFGRLFMQVYGSERRALLAYVVGGLAGCAAALLTPVIMGASGSSILLGASGSIMCLMMAASAADPNREVWLTFFGHVKLKYIAAVYLIISMMMLLALSNVGGNLAHLGGALAGWVMCKAWADKTWRHKEPSAYRGKMKLTRGSLNPDWDYNARKRNQDLEVDRILDKIGRDGYNSLTDEEKRTLFDASGKKS